MTPQDIIKQLQSESMVDLIAKESHAATVAFYNTQFRNDLDVHTAIAQAAIEAYEKASLKQQPTVIRVKPTKESAGSTWAREIGTGKDVSLKEATSWKDSSAQELIFEKVSVKEMTVEEAYRMFYEVTEASHADSLRIANALAKQPSVEELIGKIEALKYSVVEGQEAAAINKTTDKAIAIIRQHFAEKGTV